MTDKIVSNGFSNKLKKLRHDRGWSQGQLAKKLDVNTQRISKYERGVITPPSDMMVRIATTYDVSLDYLLRDGFETAAAKIKNKKLLNKLEAINDLPKADQETVISFLDAFIKRRKFEKLVHG